MLLIEHQSTLTILMNCFKKLSKLHFCHVKCIFPTYSFLLVHTIHRRTQYAQPLLTALNFFPLLVEHPWPCLLSRRIHKNFSLLPSNTYGTQKQFFGPFLDRFQAPSEVNLQHKLFFFKKWDLIFKLLQPEKTKHKIVVFFLYIYIVIERFIDITRLSLSQLKASKWKLKWRNTKFFLFGFEKIPPPEKRILWVQVSE